MAVTIQIFQPAVVSGNDFTSYACAFVSTKRSRLSTLWLSCQSSLASSWLAAGAANARDNIAIWGNMFAAAMRIYPHHALELPLANTSGERQRPGDCAPAGHHSPAICDTAIVEEDEHSIAQRNAQHIVAMFGFIIREATNVVAGVMCRGLRRKLRKIEQGSPQPVADDLRAE